jgi:phage terminase large subunit-like protein
MNNVVSLKAVREIKDAEAEDIAYRAMILSMSKLELLEEMVRYQEERSRIGHLTPSLMIRGKFLFKALEESAETHELRLLTCSYRRHLEHEYRARFGVLVNVSNLAVLDTNSKFEPLIGKPGDGASPSCAIHDEYHEHATSDQYDTMATGMGARSQPLQLVITTAGSNIGGPCYTHQVELQKILEGLVTDDRRWGIIYSVDPGDDWTDPAILLKANPNLGISIDEESLVADQAEAVRDPRKAAVFRTKRLNVWVNSAHPWLNLESLQKGADPTLTLDQFRGEHCWVGLDLASKTDIASKANVFRREVAGEWHYYVITRNWLPEAAVQKPENEHYRAWVQQGHLVQTPGNMIDLRLIQDDVEVGAEHHLVAEIAMDAWGSREIAPALQQSGFTVVDVPMTTRHLSEPMKLIAALVDAGRLHHDGNLASTWMFSNVECVEDRNGNIFPRKAKPELKIDAAIATILAIGRAIAGGDQAVVPQIISFDLTPA